MNRTEKMQSILAGLVALVVILFAVACQPTAQTEDAPLPPPRTVASEIDTAQPPPATVTPETDRSQPPPATKVPVSADASPPAVTVASPTSVVPQPSPPAEGKMPLPTAPAQMPHRDLIGPSPEAEKVIILTQKDLAQRMSITDEVILVQSIEPVTWPDASLGCPVQGQVYAQVLTPGYRVILEAGGQIYEYHTGPSSTLLICEGQDAGQAPAGEPDAAVQDGWPSHSRDPDLIIVPPPKR